MTAPETDHILRAPEGPEEWAAYHTIRRTALFEPYHPEIVYDPDHPDERAPGNHPLVLVKDGDVVGTIRIDLIDAANPAGFVKAGRLYLSKAWQPTRNRQLGLQIGFEDPSPQEESRGGQIYPLALFRRRVATFTLPGG